MPLGVLFAMKTLEDEWYVVIKFAVFEILSNFLDYHDYIVSPPSYLYISSLLTTIVIATVH